MSAIDTTDRDLYDRVDEMVCCVLDCGLGGRALNAYIDEWMSDRGDGNGTPENADAIVSELRQQLAEMDPASRAYFRETYEAIESAIRSLEPSGGDR